MPAAALRGLTKVFSPASRWRSFSASKSSRRMNTSPRTSSTGGVDALQPLRDRADRAHGVRHVLAGLAVAARGGLLQHAALVAQVDRQAVELQLGRVPTGGASARQLERVAHRASNLQRAGFGGVGLGLDRQHRHRMPHRLEALAHRADHRCVGESGVSSSGCAASIACSSLEQPVVLGVGNLRLVEHVVPVRVVVQQLAQLGHALRGLRSWWQRPCADSPAYAAAPRQPDGKSRTTRRCTGSRRGSMADHDFDLITLGAGSGGVAASRRAAAARRQGRHRRGRPRRRHLRAARLRAEEAADVRRSVRRCAAPRRPATAGRCRSTTAAFDMARWQAAKTAETARLEGVYRNHAGAQRRRARRGPRRASSTPTRSSCGHAPDHAHATSSSPPARRRCATGFPASRAARPRDDLLDLAALPDRAAFIGGGYIAVEFASMLARLGVKVSLLYRDRLPLRGFDADLRTRLAARAARDAGVELHAGPGARCASTARRAPGG